MKLFSVLVGAVLWLHQPLVSATERGHVAVVKAVYPTANGTFVVSLSSESPYCTNGSVPKYYYVSVGQNGVTADGHKLIYAAVLTALTTGYQVSFAFDNATGNCYINRLSVLAP